MTLRYPTPVLEIGGTHLMAALVDNGTSTILPGSLTRAPIRSQGTTEELIYDIVRAAQAMGRPHRSEWAVAIPGPFDYERGIGLFEHVGKFDSLFGVNLRSVLVGRISPPPTSIHFLNDAVAFGIGEFAIGAARGYQRAVCITLGTGIGSAFLDGGDPVSTGPDVPPSGSVHLLTFRGRPLEDTVSRRAIRASYGAATDSLTGPVPDVHTIAERSRHGDQVAQRVLHDAFCDLGAALGSSLSRFGADVLVIGGSMAGSWDIVEPSIRQGLSSVVPLLSSLAIKPAQRPDDSALVGAAYWAARDTALR